MTDYGASDTSTTTLGANQFPISEAWVPNAALTPTEGIAVNTDAGGKRSTAVRVGMLDGDQATLGAKADTAATTDTGTFTLMALFKRLLQGITTGNTNTGTVAGAVTSNKMAVQLIDVAGTNIAGVDSSNRVKIAPAPANAGVIIGQVKVVDSGGTNQASVSAAGAQKVDGSAVTQPSSRTTVALFSATQTAQGSGNSGDLTVGPYTAIGIDVNLTASAGTNPTIQFFWDRKGIADGIYYPLWQSDLIQGLPANPTALSTSIGAGMEFPQFLGTVGRLRWLVGGTATPTYTFTPNVQGN
jgi:hypothetical protein